VQHRAVALPGKQKVCENPLSLPGSLERRGVPWEEVFACRVPQPWCDSGGGPWLGRRLLRSLPEEAADAE